MLYLLNLFRFQTNLKIYSGKPDISFNFNSGKNIISKRENLKTKQYYLRQISDKIKTNYYLKNGNKSKSLTSEFQSQIFKVAYLIKSHIFKDYEHYLKNGYIYIYIYIIYIYIYIYIYVYIYI